MSRPQRPTFPGSRQRLDLLGERIRLARLRRRISAKEMAARVGVSRMTIHRLERGEPSISLGILERTLGVLGLDQDVDLLGGNDELGQRLQDLALTSRPRRRVDRTAP